ncbi:putative glutathione peroxidase 4 [Glycine soja]|uniref:Glutathione peroxidase n=1 Tax=Glycine soja TaxID=3848 RepID=A0A445LCH4_GLYSO|nr:putative glutathione peroxidase 4 [Glycine soja]
MGASLSVSEKSIHEFMVKDAKGRDVNLSIYKGKVLLVVNVASKCGFTNTNYTQLTELYSKYKDRGLEILAFPCNQFLKQEPGSSQDVEEFACTRYKAAYPIFGKVGDRGSGNPFSSGHLSPVKEIFNVLSLRGETIRERLDLNPEKVRVNGPDTAPVYKFLKANKSGFLGSRIKWNFTKFLVDKEGNVLRRYGSTTSPFSIEVQSLSISLHGAYVRLCSFHLDFDVSALNNAKSCHLRLRFQDTNGARQSHIALQGYATISCVNVCGYCYVTRGLNDIKRALGEA